MTPCPCLPALPARRPATGGAGHSPVPPFRPPHARAQVPGLQSPRGLHTQRQELRRLLQPRG